MDSSRKLELWVSSQQCTTDFQKEFYYFMTPRAAGIFDGTGGKTQWGMLDVNHKPMKLSLAVQDQLLLRLEKRNAQQYDRDVQLTLATWVEPKRAGWLRNLVAKSFLQLETLGASVLGLCHLTGLVRFGQWKPVSIPV